MSRLFTTLFFAFLITGQVQASTPEPSPVFNNLVFIVLAATALFLIAVIAGLSSSVKMLTEANRKKLKSKSSGAAIISLILLGSTSAFAQDAAVTETVSQPLSVGGLDIWVFSMLLAFIIAELVIIFGLVRTIRKLMVPLTDNPAETLAVKPLFNWAKFGRTLNDAVPVELEETVLTDHEYDGIRELDNNLPPWWKYGFYFTIIVGVIYLVNYHVLKNLPLSEEEYRLELAAAEKQQAAKKTSSAAIDENTVTLLIDPAMLAAGKEIYTGNCAPCHGGSGEGGVGPNLTDEYWLHGGGINNIFKIIKYGVPEKGMISWKQQLNPEAIQKVASYIMSLEGTKPANAKEPQGEIWKATSEDEAEAQATAELSMSGN